MNTVSLRLGLFVRIVEKKAHCQEHCQLLVKRMEIEDDLTFKNKKCTSEIL